jgi:membrane-bound lytic murein transglycosylase D
MKKQLRWPLGFLCGSLVTILIVTQVSFKEPDPAGDRKTSRELTLSAFKGLEVPQSMTFAGEKVPLEKWEVWESFDRELTLNYFATGNLLYILKLSRRWFPLIEERLKMHGVPDDFKYLCVAESNLQNLISKAGAVGFWQFMSYTSPGYNLQVNSVVDQRYDVLKSTDAACQYLKTAYNKFGNWTAAAASYNCGMGGYNSAATFQGTYNYYDLFLPDETNKYIFRILTFKHLMTNMKDLEYDLTGIELYKPQNVRTITVSSSIANLAEFARNNGTNYKVLKILNPWLRGRNLSVSGGKTYEIRLPK